MYCLLAVFFTHFMKKRYAFFSALYNNSDDDNNWRSAGCLFRFSHVVSFYFFH